MSVKTETAEAAVFNKRLLYVIALLSIIIIFRLFDTGIESDNVRGALYSTAHVLIVGIGAFFTLRKPLA